MEEKIEYVKSELLRRRGRGEWNEIARRAKVGRRTLSYLMNTDHGFRTQTIDRLYKHLKKLERKA